MVKNGHLSTYIVRRRLIDGLKILLFSVVAQMTARSLPIPDNLSSNPVISNFYCTSFQLFVEKLGK